MGRQMQMFMESSKDVIREEKTQAFRKLFFHKSTLQSLAVASIDLFCWKGHVDYCN